MSDTNAALTRLVVAHGVLAAVPPLLVCLLLGWWWAAVPVAVVVGVVATVVRTVGIDGRIARTIEAQPVDGEDVPRLASLAETMSMTVGEPMPDLFVIDTPARNAISWGVSNGPSKLAVTRGLLDATDRVELEAVVGHQLNIVHDRAVAVITLAAALFGPLARGPFAAPLASLVGADIEHQVERADIGGAIATRFPPALVAVLDRLRAEPTEIPTVPRAMSGLCFAAPHHGEGPFAVHPPIEDRIDLLREI